MPRTSYVSLEKACSCPFHSFSRLQTIFLETKPYIQRCRSWLHVHTAMSCLRVVVDQPSAMIKSFGPPCACFLSPSPKTRALDVFAFVPGPQFKTLTGVCCCTGCSCGQSNGTQKGMSTRNLGKGSMGDGFEIRDVRSSAHLKRTTTHEW